MIQSIFAPDALANIKKLNAQLKKQDLPLKSLVELTFHPDKHIALRGAKILEYMLLKFPADHYTELEYLLEHVCDVTTPGIIKHYAKILAGITAPDMPRKVRDKIKELRFEYAIEISFIWLADANKSARVRTTAADMLFNLRHQYPCIAEALSTQLELLIANASPTLAAKGTYILSFLHCED